MFPMPGTHSIFMCLVTHFSLSPFNIPTPPSFHIHPSPNIRPRHQPPVSEVQVPQQPADRGVPLWGERPWPWRPQRGLHQISQRGRCRARGGGYCEFFSCLKCVFYTFWDTFRHFQIIIDIGHCFIHLLYMDLVLVFTLWFCFRTISKIG